MSQKIKNDTLMGTDLFLNQMHRYGQLDDNEQKELFMKLQRGKKAEEKLDELNILSSHPDYNREAETDIKDLENTVKEGKKARETLICSNFGLIQKIVTTELHRNKSDQDYDDLIQEGNARLTKTVDTYDPESNTKFSTFAYTSIASELKGLLQDKAIKLLRRDPEFRKYDDAKKKLKRIKGTKPTVKETSEYMLNEKYRCEGTGIPIGEEYDRELSKTIQANEKYEVELRRLNSFYNPTSIQLEDDYGDSLTDKISDRHDYANEAETHIDTKEIMNQTLQDVLYNLKTEDEKKVFSYMFVGSKCEEEDREYVAYKNKDLSAVLKELQSPNLPDWKIKQIYHRIMRLYRLPSKYHKLESVTK